ncbi:MAG TPA: bifunctional 4-hydroxy-2-oxoglutarate aldolase/2-dehydro-3-deoxy-phosphogluconate aldolase, partial [Bryobacteraceae bacterium]|nr:bifunctional 4-hydroxy-2-oxoglutarate aldolase/2-dehydro-3-deoxy-phosphogluconate aldolase [Bryobacteraceae bacterium]
DVRTRIEQSGIIPAIRVLNAEDAMFAANAVFDGGILVAELTMTIPGAPDVIRELVKRNPEAAVGAGTVLDVETARRCLDAGASFLTSTGLDRDMVAFAEKHKIAVIPGALTPTEVMIAHKAGVDFVKIFPCAQVGGPAYIKALKAPFPHVPMIASGGVNQQTAGDFIHAGAIALGIGEDLIPRDAIENRDLDWIRELCRRFQKIVKRAREPK